MEKQVDMQLLGQLIAGEYVRCTPAVAQTFIRMFELLRGLSTLPERQCYSAAKRIFPSEFAAYQSAVEAGEIAPLVCGPYSNRFAVTFPELN